MADIFPPWSNTAIRLAIVLVVVGVIASVAAVIVFVRTPWRRKEYEPIDQPVVFDHRHHTQDDGIDCRFCHTTADRAATAGIPSTDLCMGCHNQIWNQSPMLEPVSVTCHGRVDQMARVYQVASLTMAWCLDCHRAPETRLRPVEQVTSATWKDEGEETSVRLAHQLGVQRLTHCTTCHR